MIVRGPDSGQPSSATVLPPLVGNPRYRLIDVWRGVACLMVVLHHAGFAVVFESAYQPGLEPWLRRAVVGTLWRMSLGVPLFFVISGYCIAASADATRRRNLRSLTFLGRRIWRIYPPYWAALLFFVVTTGGLDALGLDWLYHGSGHHALQLDPPQSLDRIQWLGNITLTETWRPLVWHPPEAKIFTRIAWSLCYEEQFYFVCFVALLLAPKRLYVALAWITVGAVLLRVVAADIGRYHQVEGAFPALWHEFAIGLAVYWRLNVPGSFWARRAVEAGLVALALYGTSGAPATPVGYSTATAAAFGLVLIVLRRWDEPLERAAWLAPLRACGRRCYSIYLVHLPVCTAGCLLLYELGVTSFWGRALVTVPLTSAAAVGASWLFFAAVERHFLNPPIVLRDARAEQPAVRPLAGEAAVAPQLTTDN